LHITEVFTTWKTTADPAGGGDLGDEVLRVLDTGSKSGDEGGVLIGEEGLGDGITCLAGATDFGVLEVGFHPLVTATAAHEWDGEEGAFLGANVAASVGHAGLVLEDGVGVNALIVEPVSFAGVHHVVFHGEGVDLAGIRDEIGSGILARAMGLFGILENGGGVVLGFCETLNIHSAPILLIVPGEKL
jgi:hypothetical protein